MYFCDKICWPIIRDNPVVERAHKPCGSQRCECGCNSPSSRVIAALDLANRYGGIDGDHHRAWLIDQMVRILTGCPIYLRSAIDHTGVGYTYHTLGESDEYREWVRAHKNGDGPDSHDWPEGIPP